MGSWPRLFHYHSRMHLFSPLEVFTWHSCISMEERSQVKRLKQQTSCSQRKTEDWVRKILTMQFSPQTLECTRFSTLSQRALFWTDSTLLPLPSTRWNATWVRLRCPAFPRSLRSKQPGALLSVTNSLWLSTKAFTVEIPPTLTCLELS